MVNVLFEESNSRAFQELVNGLIESFSITKLLVYSELEGILPDFAVEARFIESSTDVSKFVDSPEQPILLLHLTERPATGQGITPRWLWDLYESGATVLRIRPSNQNLGTSFLRNEAQKSFEDEISLPPLLKGLMIPPAYCNYAIFSTLYNREISNAAVLASKEVLRHRPVAILAVYNERDIIGEALIDLIDEGCDVFILDNWSDDGSLEVVEEFRCKFPERVLGIRRFPDKPTAKTSLTDIVTAKEEVALQFPGRWIINADADEFRRSPISGLTLAQALECASLYGANRVNFTILNMRPVDDGHPPLNEYRSYFRYFELPDHASYFAQARAWLQPVSRVDLATSGGHVAEFAEAKDFPIRFWMKHIPIRSPLHASKKIDGERAKRWSDAELKMGWHTHYASECSQSYIWTAETLHRLDDAVFSTDYSIALATSLALYFSPVWTGQRSEMRRWVDESVVRTINQQKHEIDELRHQLSVLRAWLSSLDLGVETQSVEGRSANSHVFSIKSQLNSTLVTFLSTAPRMRRRIYESRASYHERLLASFFFKDNWYVNRYPDVQLSGMKPAAHYIHCGAAEGRDPTSYFSTLQYLTDNPDVAAAGMNPLLHFLLYGAREGRNGVHRVV